MKKEIYRLPEAQFPIIPSTATTTDILKVRGRSNQNTEKYETNNKETTPEQKLEEETSPIIKYVFAGTIALSVIAICAKSCEMDKKADNFIKQSLGQIIQEGNSTYETDPTNSTEYVNICDGSTLKISNSYNA